MAFLDNSGDIILDAVLTDLGRELLAKGDGSFEISSFALADDEIDYSLYNKNHPSGSSYYDLEILQTPVMEAFTDNAASCKNKLVSFDNLELLFMPTLLLNEKIGPYARHATYNTFLVCVDAFTEDDDGGTTTKGIAQDYSTGVELRGILRGETLKGPNHIRIDQGIDNSELSPRRNLGDLVEDQYIVQMDNRLIHLADIQGSLTGYDYVDDDHQAFYTVSLGSAGSSIVNLIADTTNSTTNVHAGPRGTKVEFKLQSSMDLQTSTFLFERLGGVMTGVPNRGNGTTDLYYIDTLIRVYGTKTGQSIDIPVRLVKYKS
tara:strand:- start:1282 stop:2235 length:954 start_codon:yes stop_codon:yes gene_type:complete